VTGKGEGDGFVELWLWTMESRWMSIMKHTDDELGEGGAEGIYFDG